MRHVLHISLLFFLLGGLVILESCGSRKKTQKTQSSSSESENFDSYFIDAMSYFNTTNYDMANKLFTKCTEIRPNEASPYYYLSKIKYENTDLSSEGLQYAMRAVNLAPENPEYSIWCASKLRAVNNIDEAIRILEHCSSSNPKDEVLANELDALYARKFLVDKRITLWNTMMEKKGFTIKNASRLIELHKMNKDYASAHKLYAQIQKAAPLKYKYMVDEGNLYLQEGDEQKAFEKYNQALSINPNIWELNRHLFKHYFDKKDSSNALKYLKLGMSDPQTPFQAKANSISMVKALSVADSSMKPYLNIIGQALFDLYPSSDQAMNIAGYCFEYNTRYNLACESYLKSVQTNPSYEAYCGLIRSTEKYLGANKTLPYVDSALELYPNTIDLYIQGYELALKCKYYPLATEYANRGLSFAITPEMKAKFISMQANGLLQSGQLPEALKICENGLAIYPDNSMLLEIMGDILFKSGKNAEAAAYWKKALEKGGDSNELTKKIREGN